MRAVVRSEGVGGGVAVGAAVILLGVAGLSPSLAWIPEGLLAAFFLVPIAILGAVGFRAGSRAGKIAGGLAGALAGAIGGCVGGLTYVAFGKPVVNVVVGVVAGVLGGGLIGATGALLASYRTYRR